MLKKKLKCNTGRYKRCCDHIKSVTTQVRQGEVLESWAKDEPFCCPIHWSTFALLHILRQQGHFWFLWTGSKATKRKKKDKTQWVHVPFFSLLVYSSDFLLWIGSLTFRFTVLVSQIKLHCKICFNKVVFILEKVWYSVWKEKSTMERHQRLFVCRRAAFLYL